jgi:hypothetical protein
MLRVVILIGLWCVLVLAGLAGPALLGSTVVGDDRIRFTIRLAMLGYALAVAGMLTSALEDQRSLTPRLRWARWLWSLAVATYLIHVALAFHYYHHWSHAEAYERTERMTNFGPGIYISYLFSVVWMLDALFWWVAPGRYARRSTWAGCLLHSFLAFIIFNGAVIFAQGPIRWWALAGFVGLGLLGIRRFLQVSSFPLYHGRSPGNPPIPARSPE